jgi:acyl transferase domain-containing protein
LNFSKLNSYIDFSETKFKLLTKNIPWNDTSPLVAGMSCFGFGGSNTHMVISEHIPHREAIDDNKETYLFTVSARNKNSLSLMVKKMVNYLNSNNLNNHNLSDISFTLNVGRDHFEYRVALLANNKDTLIGQLNEINCEYISKIVINKSIYAPPLNDSNYLASCKDAYLEGGTLAWHYLYKRKANRRINLPGYVFNTKHCWFEGHGDE